MLLMQHPVFRRFWYPTLAISELRSGPKAFTLLGEDLVRFAHPATCGSRTVEVSGTIEADVRRLRRRTPRT